MLHGTPIKSNQFAWDLTLNLTNNNNKVVKLLGEDKNNDGIEDDLVSSGLFIGKPIGTIYDYQTQGIYQLVDEKLAGFQAGTYKFNDFNGDKKITAAVLTFGQNRSIIQSPTSGTTSTTKGNNTTLIEVKVAISFMSDSQGETVERQFGTITNHTFRNHMLRTKF